MGITSDVNEIRGKNERTHNSSPADIFLYSWLNALSQYNVEAKKKEILEVLCVGFLLQMQFFPFCCVIIHVLDHASCSTIDMNTERAFSYSPYYLQ